VSHRKGELTAIEEASGKPQRRSKLGCNGKKGEGKSKGKRGGQSPNCFQKKGERSNKTISGWEKVSEGSEGTRKSN